MIHYNPEEHHDKLVNHITEAYLAGAELDQPLMPHKNNGEPNYALCDGEEIYLFTDAKLHKQLFIDAFQKTVELLHSTDQEPKGGRTSIGCGTFDPDPETSRINALKEAFTSSKESGIEQWVEEKTQEIINGGVQEQEAKRLACIAWSENQINTSEFNTFNFGEK